MFRTLSLLIVVFASVIGSLGQVTVTNQGFATTPGPGIPATPASPPILITPVVHLDQGSTQPTEASATAVQELGTQSSEMVPTVGSRQQVFNFGVAQFDTLSMQGSVGQPIDGKSLGEFAREMRQKQTKRTARTYTNSDIQNLEQPAGISGTPTGEHQGTANWAPNNGVIDPRGVPAQDSIREPTEAQAPAPFQKPTPAGPKLPSVTPAPKP